MVILACVYNMMEAFTKGFTVVEWGGSKIEWNDTNKSILIIKILLETQKNMCYNMQIIENTFDAISNIAS